MSVDDVNDHEIFLMQESLFQKDFLDLRDYLFYEKLTKSDSYLSVIFEEVDID
jgi:hypothetical protein